MDNKGTSRTINKDIYVEMTRLWFEKHANYKSLNDAVAVVGISGGKDSSVVAALLKEALGKDHVLGIMLPNGIQKDIQDSFDVCEFLQIRNWCINIGSSYNQLIAALENTGPSNIKWNYSENPGVTTNLPARLRMATLYAVAAQVNGRVIGTGNMSESVVGYYTLWGDGACDFNPIADLYVDEVIELGRQLGLPDKFILKTPSDGMSGKSDEENLGFTYDDVKKFCELDESVKIGEGKWLEISKKIKATQFKRNLTKIPHIDVYGNYSGFVNVG